MSSEIIKYLKDQLEYHIQEAERVRKMLLTHGEKVQNGMGVSTPVPAPKGKSVRHPLPAEILQKSLDKRMSRIGKKLPR